MASGIQSHRDLVVWQRGMDLVEQIYALTKRLPDASDSASRTRQRAPRSACRRTLRKVMLRGTRRDYAHFVAIAKGSWSPLLPVPCTL